MYFLQHKELGYLVAADELPKKNINKYTILTEEEYNKIAEKQIETIEEQTEE